MNRNLSQLTWPEIGMIEKAQAVIVLPFGAVEQHGAHLSTDCDLYFADRLLDLALSTLADDVPVWRLPALPITKSNEHAGFPGTFWLSAATLTSVVRDISAGAAASGFLRLALFNCHGGNRSLLESIARDVRIETGLSVFCIFPPALVPDPVDVSPREAMFGIHAGDWETSLMMALDPERVRMQQRSCFYPDIPDGPLAIEFTGATFAWTTRDLSPTGLFGDATIATAERGRRRLEALIPKIAEALAACSSFGRPPSA